MTTIIINEKKTKGKSLIEYLKLTYTSDIVKFSENEIANDVRTALKEVKAGKAKPIENLFK